MLDFQIETFFENQEAALKQIYQQLELGDFNKIWPVFEKEIKTYDNYKTNTYRLSERLENRVKKEWAFAYEAFGYEKK